jgi:trigger factor
MKKGETKAVEVVFPENYHEKSLSGKKAVFDITVKEIKKEVVPELDDDFAKTVDEDCETLSDLKKKIEEDLKRRAELVSKDKLYDSIIKRLIDENPFTLPESMVDEQANRLADQALKHYQYMYGISPDKLGLKREDVAKTMREKAIFQIKAALILNKIGEMEEIKVTEEDIDEKIKEYAEKLNKDFDEYKKELISNKQIKNLEDNILTEKIFLRLIELNKVETKVVEKKNEEAAAMANDNSEDLNSSETVDETEQENKNEQENKDEEKI